MKKVITIENCTQCIYFNSDWKNYEQHSMEDCNYCEKMRRILFEFDYYTEEKYIIPRDCPLPDYKEE